VPRAGLWAAVTGALSVVPFLGYGAAAAVSLQLATQGAAASSMLAFGLGSAILFVGDKVVRPVAARGGTHLPFVWLLMGCLGGFEALGLVVGPVALSLARELWRQRARKSAVRSADREAIMCSGISESGFRPRRARRR
jgi:predicted PurR-regulated permease PerM